MTRSERGQAVLGRPANKISHRSPTGKKRRWKPRAVDLFAGCGGLSLGLRQAGFRVAAAVEIDPLAAETYRKNHPDVQLWQGDIRKLSARTVARRLNLPNGGLSLLAGCPPCQAWSRMPRLNGGRQVRDRKQKDLVLQFLRFVRVLRPKALMLENVPDLAKDPRMSVLRRTLRKLGYSYVQKVVDASEHGVSQRRRRMILLAGKLGPLRFPTGKARRKTVEDVIGELRPPGLSGDPLHDMTEHRSLKVINLIAAIPKDGGSRRDLGRRRQLGCHKRCDGFGDVYGRMAWNEVAPTITSGFVNPSKGRFLHPTQDRTITLREGALLQGFPRGYKVSLREGKFRAAELIGNALPPPLIRRLASPLVPYVRRQKRQREN